MKIELSKNYKYRNGEPARILCVDAPGEWPVKAMCDGGEVTHHRLDGVAWKRTYEPLIEIPSVREPREWDAWLSPNGKVIGSPYEGYTKIRVREVPAPSEFPEVGAELEFLCDNFQKADEAQGARVRVVQVDKDGFWTTKSGSKGVWFFKENWRDGLELVTEPPIPAEPTGVVVTEGQAGLGDTDEPQPEWRELGEDDGVFLSDDEVSSKQNSPDEGGLTADRVALTGSRISDYPGLRARCRVSAEEAEAKASPEPEKTDPYEALKEAEAGLEVAIAVIAKELSGRDWQKSSPRLALEIVKKALAENGGEK